MPGVEAGLGPVRGRLLVLQAACVAVVVCVGGKRERQAAVTCAPAPCGWCGASRWGSAAGTHARAHTHTHTCAAPALLACNRWRARRKRACSDMSSSSMWMATGAGVAVLEEEEEEETEAASAGCADAAPAQDEKHRAPVC